MQTKNRVKFFTGWMPFQIHNQSSEGRLMA